MSGTVVDWGALLASVDWLFVSNLVVAAGTGALAVATFVQGRSITRERKAARARETIDTLLGPVMPFSRRLGDRFWIYRGLSMEQWSSAARVQPHLVARLPPKLVEDLDFLTDGAQHMQRMRNHVLQLYYDAAEVMATQHLHQKDPNRRGVSIRLVLDGKPEMTVNPVEIFVMRVTSEEWCGQEAKRHKAETWSLLPDWGGYNAGTSEGALRFLNDAVAWLSTHPAAIELQRHFDELASRGASAQAQFEATLQKLSKIEREG